MTSEGDTRPRADGPIQSMTGSGTATGETELGVVTFWAIFLLSSIFMIFVILLQEPKGGGLAEAFGGMGAETFGVKSGGVNRFTLHTGRR